MTKGIKAPNPICDISGCERPTKSRGWCGYHYNHWLKFGAPVTSHVKKPRGTCSIDGCGKPHFARSWCSRHYWRWQHHGDPLWRPTPRPSEMRHVDKTGACWMWTGRRDANGYGRANQAWAHRWVYEQVVGPIPKGLELHHVCGRGRKGCVTPHHMVPVTHSEHMKLEAARRTHCANGHSWDRDDVYIRPDNGKRQCTACARERRRKKPLIQEAT